MAGSNREKPGIEKKDQKKVVLGAKQRQTD